MAENCPGPSTETGKIVFRNASEGKVEVACPPWMLAYFGAAGGEVETRHPLALADAAVKYAAGIPQPPMTWGSRLALYKFQLDQCAFADRNLLHGGEDLKDVVRALEFADEHREVLRDGEKSAATGFSPYAEILSAAKHWLIHLGNLDNSANNHWGPCGPPGYPGSDYYSRLEKLKLESSAE